MKEIGAIGKNKRNSQGQGYMYRGVDDVMNALEPAMEKHGVFVVPEVLDQTREERTSKTGGNLLYSICKIRYSFYCEDGSNVQATVIGEAMDSGDKATNKAMSVAFKYACFQVFCIPTEEMQDPDATTPPPSSPKDNTKANKPTTGKPNPANASNNVPPEAESSLSDKIDQPKIKTLQNELIRTGVKDSVILNMCKIKNVGDMTNEQFVAVMKKFEATPDKK